MASNSKVLKCNLQLKIFSKIFLFFPTKKFCSKTMANVAVEANNFEVINFNVLSR